MSDAQHIQTALTFPHSASSSTNSSRAQWALRDLKQERQISVGTAGPQREHQIAVGTAGPQHMPERMSE